MSFRRVCGDEDELETEDQKDLLVTICKKRPFGIFVETATVEAEGSASASFQKPKAENTLYYAKSHVYPTFLAQI